MNEIEVRADKTMVMEEEVEIVEIEIYGKRNEKPPRAKHYLVRIDRDKYTFGKRFVTGQELLEKAGKMPFNRWRIHQKLHGGQMKEIGYDQEVDLGAPGVERFTTFEVTVTDGEDHG